MRTLQLRDRGVSWIQNGKVVLVLVLAVACAKHEQAHSTERLPHETMSSREDTAAWSIESLRIKRTIKTPMQTMTMMKKKNECCANVALLVHDGDGDDDAADGSIDLVS
jgi:hypothetical protein